MKELPNGHKIEPGKRIRVRPLPSNVTCLMMMVTVADKGFRLNGKKSKCWIWRGRCDKDGYPQVKAQQVVMFAHRWSYAIFHQDFALDNFDVDHVCEEPKCINPAHLQKRDSYTHRATAMNPPAAGSAGYPVVPLEDEPLPEPPDDIPF